MHKRYLSLGHVKMPLPTKAAVNANQQALKKDS